MKRLSVILLALSVCSGCKYSAAPYYGQLLVTDERGFVLVQLPSTDETVILPASSLHAVYGHPTFASPGNIFWSDAQRLVRLELKTKRIVEVGRGVWPTYVPEHDLLFFWRSSEGANDPSSQMLLVRKLTGAPNQKVVTSFSGVWRSNVVQLSPDQVAFYGQENHVWEYSISSSTLSPTEVEGCLPVAWRSKSSQLICQNTSNHKVYLSDLHGQASIVPVQAYEVLGYSPSYDAVIYTAAYGLPWQLAVGWAILAYNFRDHRTVRLAWTKPGASGIFLDREGKPL